MKQNQKETVRAWQFSIGFYPGILFGIRSYGDDDDSVTHVLYLPFVDFSIEFFNMPAENEE